MPLTRRMFLASSAASLSAAQSKRPNIVFIMADDLGYADLSCYGRRDYTTPNIDRLASEGARFTQAYANSCVCSPSRTALITGRYHYRLRVGLEEPLAGSSNLLGLPPEHPTLPSLLKKSGYRTALVGKWHLGQLPKYGPLQSGYEQFYGFRGGGVDYFTHKNSPTASAVDLWENDTRLDQPGYLTDLLGNKAVSLIQSFSKQAAPFFMSVHFNAPHWPWEGPEDEAVAKTLKNPINFDGGSQATYAAIVRRLDFQVGRILETLKSTGLAANTIVIFTSDNGGERFSDTWPFKGTKTDLLEGGLRVPAIMRWPGHISPKTVSQQVTINMDWLPTLLAAAGTSPDPAYPSDGIDITPHITAPVPRKFYWRYRHNSQRAVRDGDMKYLTIAGNQYLFNVVSDPMERANLKSHQPALLSRLAADFDAWNATMLPEDPNAYTHFFSPEDLADHNH